MGAKYKNKPDVDRDYQKSIRIENSRSNFYDF